MLKLFRDIYIALNLASFAAAIILPLTVADVGATAGFFRYLLMLAGIALVFCLV